jgi:hypothetical protein
MATRMRRVAAGAARIGLAATVALLVAGCGIAAPHGSAAPVQDTATPQPTVSAAVEETRRQVAGALAPDGMQLLVPTVPFQPPEPADFDSIPRAVYQATLPDDPSHGFIVIYELPDTGSATQSGQDLAKFLASGPGRVEFPPDTQHVIRQIGTTLVFYSWSQANSVGSGASTVGTALTSIGQGIAIPQ